MTLTSQAYPRPIFKCFSWPSECVIRLKKVSSGYIMGFYCVRAQVSISRPGIRSSVILELVVPSALVSLLLDCAYDKEEHLGSTWAHPRKSWLNSNNGNSHHPFWRLSLRRTFNQDFSLWDLSMVTLKCNLILIRIQLSCIQRPLFSIDFRIQHSPQTLRWMF